MKQKMIYIEDDLFSQLSLEENASALISQLLNQHYDSLKKKELLIVEPDVFDVMEKSIKVVAKEEANNKLKDSILAEIEKQNKEEAEAAAIFNENI